MATVSIEASSGTMSAYVAEPAGEGPWPGVIVLHDAIGMSRDVRAQADWLAGAGYLALAPDLYYWGPSLRCMRAVFGEIRARRGKVFDDVEAARRTLTDDPRCTGSIGVIGYCMGGGFSLLLAPSGGYAASSVNYGTVPRDAEDLLAGACPIVGSFGARDRSLRGAAGRLERALEATGVDHDVKEYADAGHSFLNDHDPDDVPVLFRVTGRLIGGGYDPEAAADAKRRIVAFFDSHLKKA